MTGKLWFTIGLPRSGKTTYCDEWVTDHDHNRRVVVSGDAFRQALHGHAYIPEAEGVVFAHMDIAVRAFLLSGHDVIIDETATTEATILRYFRIDQEACPVWISTTAEVCIQRALDSNKPYLVDPINRMAQQLAKLKADYPGNFVRLQDYCRVRQNHDIHV